MVGVPLTTPAGDRVRPGGSEPETSDQPEAEMVAPPPAPEVVAARLRGVMAEPESKVWVPGSVTETTLEIVQLNGLVEAEAARPSRWPSPRPSTAWRSRWWACR